MSKQFARWRRDAGIWKIKLIAEGYDEEFCYQCSARLSEPFARQLARVNVAKELTESYKIVHVASAQREG